MNLPASQTFMLSAGINVKKINTILKDANMTLAGNACEPEAGTVLDTFDAAVHKSDALLIQTASDLVTICWSGDVIAQAAPESEWQFARDLPQGPVRDLLLDLSPLRAFIPEAQVSIVRDIFSLLDDEQKTCCRVETVSLSRGGNTWSWLRTRPMRGYKDSHALICDILKKMEKSELPAEVLKLKVSDYTSKPVIRLSENDPARKSLCTIVQAFLQVTRRNEPGLINDLDTEFLHQWRVSLRKVRSVLTLFKGVVATETLDRLKQDFRDIMQDTNLMRDRDVYLLSKDDYFALVPPQAHPGLGVLFELLQQERDEAFEKVKTMLESKAYKKQIKSIQKLFENPKDLPKGPKADAPSKAFAADLVLKRYKKVCTLAGSITDKTPDETIHELRIQCKKLRYLIESAQPLFDVKQVKSLLKTLKGLQAHLGSFNDQSVQQATLAQCLDRYPDTAPNAKALAESIGALTAMLYRKQLEERRLIIENLSRFYSPETQDAFNALFDLKNTATKQANTQVDS
ncbi:CHAD domain-containing protein [Desulfobacter latus]|uniref:CHAD domain-containing protein n=1 Tax=Desulfobacter latus TaxID=2292 RepID=A0A850TBJ5_9BACT|nr:CHAD domain-containing protein [Desulfobacter latus]NWH04746.1 CHAD domain-containing protein [Desulfobacter latus]